MPKSILLVEDDPVQLKMEEDFFNKEGFEVAVAASGEEALSMALKKTFDLILLDILLPRVDGVEVCRRIKKSPNNTNTKIIAVTSFDVTDVQKKAQAAGVDDLVIKPLNFVELSKKIKTLLGN
ncbi:hypothetical protein A2276_01520 [candidate division WOR-1 bacterium RIFOXYA12_FULL_43_27]|uniref:Response regulatory domain-containing protein n=1 Tax=candidate division WOR-1 bacterium RIFOXYC2_FULL_46_14 TaxID=1802587 RepID=A0A1F4U6X0_UNCSA|nr:MAG: hypothetical protein A2276_01520 [candidate division WOR-1 bacterium RIFOXYA12_FULL_43_27]OGC19595.1 MAG: hypothetical protein A2292_02810 [candidate division WOR-1 bacterium RIFOXYB2_FULL_46_45]OGC30584.1 MAG: hypothetical protein A2232_02810 [candidate division WOR-1 bacterium RIFOXYA2_FULL_46_56]OGC40651.1 MAG: hypothetical protein A2438_06525 [candidate division WOR-1 bacterium RIFOXYC2_FULL_46_14]